MPTNTPQGWLDALNWGTSTGGSAGAAETTNTLGTETADTQVPPTKYHLGNLRIERMRQLLLSMTAFMKGGTRLQVLTQSSNPFAAGEAGFWTDGTNAKFTATSGTITTLGSGGGGSATLATAYSNGASQTDETLTLDSTRLGPVFKGYASMNTPLLTLQFGTTPGVNNDAIRIQDSTLTSVAVISKTGSIASIGSSAGFLSLVNGLGATTASTISLTNATASTAMATVQVSPSVQWLAHVWDTTPTASDVTHYWRTGSIPVSGSPARAELRTAFSTDGSSYTDALTLSSGSTTAAPTGLAVLSATSTAPTLLAPGGALTVKSSAANGATPSTTWDTANSFNNNNVYQWKNAGTHLFSMYPAGTATYFGFDSGVTRYMLYNSSTLTLSFGGLSAVQLISGTSFLPAADGGSKVGTNGNSFGEVNAYFHGTVLGGALASATTITPTSSIHHVTGTSAISTIATTNLPTGFKGSIVLIPDGAFTTGTSGNIGLASTAVVGKALTMTWDGTKWYPSY